MNHPQLDLHQTIAWDMDQTLIGGPNSDFFRDYIVRNPQKEHHVVTFRDKEWADAIYLELEACGMLQARTLIKAVHNCPERIFDLHKLNYSKRLWALKMGHTAEELDDASYHVVRFKGSKAAEIGATVLVDDIPVWVVPGCNENNIVFVHALHPIPGQPTKTRFF